MNLDVTKKMMDKDLNKAKALIDKSLEVTKKSLEDLRKAVYALKEDNPLSLSESIKDLIGNFQDIRGLNFSIDVDEKIDNLPQLYRDMIYQSLKEAITNSIKHGDAKLITITIKYLNSKLKVSVKDNGLGTSDLIKGNGLLGIENKIQSLGGRVNYNYGPNEGFEVVIILDIM